MRIHKKHYYFINSMIKTLFISKNDTFTRLNNYKHAPKTLLIQMLYLIILHIRKTFTTYFLTFTVATKNTLYLFVLYQRYL